MQWASLFFKLRIFIFVKDFLFFYNTIDQPDDTIKIFHKKDLTWYV